MLVDTSLLISALAVGPRGKANPRLVLSAEVGMALSRVRVRGVKTVEKCMVGEGKRKRKRGKMNHKLHM